MYISHDVVDGNEYATVVRSAGDGARVTREDRACLGRVVDRARGVYRSKARGLFPCDLATGEFGPAPGGSRGRNARAARPTLAVSFGDAFLPGSLLRPGGLTACADACGHAEPDTVRALLASCVPAGLANRHAGDWWGPACARLPCPRARMASQEVSEHVEHVDDPYLTAHRTLPLVGERTWRHVQGRVAVPPSLRLGIERTASERSRASGSANGTLMAECSATHTATRR